MDVLFLDSTVSPVTFRLVLEELLRPKLEDVVQLLLGHGACLGSQTRAHHKVGQHHLPLGHLGDTLLHAGSRYETIYHDLVGLSDAVSSTEGLRRKR